MSALDFADKHFEGLFWFAVIALAAVVAAIRAWRQ